jgi:tetratricopeptide (TPR) repeat protein
MISLCMIVKDEEKHLAECLRSVQGLVEEIILVDTGSSDRSTEIAQSFGARIRTFPWTGDFSAARNESLRHATGDWIFYLDADERLECPGEKDCLRNLVAQERADAYHAVIWSERNHGTTADVSSNIRLFRNYPGIRFVNEVHERVEPFLQSVGARIAPSSLRIRHLGYDLNPEEMRRKLDRNLSMSFAHLKRNPEDPYALYYLALTLLMAQRSQESLQAIERALRAEEIPLQLKASALNVGGFLFLEKGEPGRALAMAGESLAIIPSQNTARLLAGLAHFELKDHRSALPHLLKAFQFLRLPPEKRHSALGHEHSFLPLPEFYKVLAICHAHLEQYAPAIPFFHRYIESRGKEGDMLRRLGICYLNSGNHSAAVRHLQEAVASGIDPRLVALPLAFAFSHLGEFEEVERYLEGFYPRDPEELRILEALQELVAKGRRETDLIAPTVHPKAERSTQSTREERLQSL